MKQNPIKKPLNIRTNAKKPVGYYIGNFFIVASLLILFYIYVPILKIYFFPSKLHDLSTQREYYIQIPSINAESKVIEEVDPFSEPIYQQALEKGVAQAKGTSTPEHNGTVFLFAHSSDAPWRITQYNTAFFRLNELKPKEPIILFYKGKKYTYHVADIKEVWPDDISFLKESMENKISRGKKIILQTCTPIGTSLKRLLIFGEQVKS